MTLVDDYFSHVSLNRQLLVWAVAARRQLERWEPLVAANVRAGWGGGPGLPSADIWQAQIEHHFTVVAARNLLHAIDLANTYGITVTPELRQEVIEGRDLLEHWKENMAIFNTTPRPAEPKYTSGKRFAARHPRHSPYSWLSWTNKRGAILLPDVTARDLHELIDRVEAIVLGKDPELARFVPPRSESPWIESEGECWPSAGIAKPEGRST